MGTDLYWYVCACARAYGSLEGGIKFLVDLRGDLLVSKEVPKPNFEYECCCVLFIQGPCISAVFKYS